MQRAWRVRLFFTESGLRRECLASPPVRLLYLAAKDHDGSFRNLIFCLRVRRDLGFDGRTIRARIAVFLMGVPLILCRSENHLRDLPGKVALVVSALAIPKGDGQR